MPHNILIAGAGQLGSRYLQGLARVSYPLSIFVQDISQESLHRADVRWREVAPIDSPHQIIFSTTFFDLPSKVDIAIVATTADVRVNVVGNISCSTEVKYWLLEKVLAQSTWALSELDEIVRNASGIWVNTSRRISDWHQQIKSKLCIDNSIKLNVDGRAWGLGCNAVHYFDLIAWWTGERLEHLDTRQLGKTWLEGRRSGFYEIAGTLVGLYTGGSSAHLSDTGTGGSLLIKLEDGEHNWFIDEVAGIAIRSDGLEIPGRTLYQSEMTKDLVESILENGCCGLPSLTESADLHRVFLRDLLDHWNQNMNSHDTVLPIT
jgi:hypothetical protein